MSWRLKREALWRKCELNLKDLINPSELLKEQRVERRWSERIQKNLASGGEVIPPTSINKDGKEKGNTIQLNNSFSILDNDEIIERSLNMGIMLNNDEFAAIDLIKDLEAARQALNQKHLNVLKQTTQTETDPVTSESDDECLVSLEELELETEDDFTLVTPKRSRKPSRRFTFSTSKPKKDNKEVAATMDESSKLNQGNLGSKKVTAKQKKKVKK